MDDCKFETNSLAFPLIGIKQQLLKTTDMYIELQHLDMYTKKLDTVSIQPIFSK